MSEDAEMSRIFRVADAVAINQLSMDGAHSLVVDSGGNVPVCPKSYATHATLEALPACWRGLDLRSASGKMLTVWGMREVYNALHGKVFTVRISFVVCEVRRPVAVLGHVGSQGHGREINLRRQENSHLVGVEFWSGLLVCEESMLRDPPGLVAPVDSVVAGSFCYCWRG